MQCIFAYTTSWPLLYKNEALQYTHAQAVLINRVINRAEHARSIVIVKTKYMLLCHQKIDIKIMLCLLNSTVVKPRFQTRRARGH